jgi:hypothetical protein
MKLEKRRSYRTAAGFAALLLAAAVAVAGTSAVACKNNHVDREGFTERSADYTTGATDKSGAGDPSTAGGDKAGTTTVTGADLGALSSDLAIERIAAARCARETACNNVGADKHFVDHDACARAIRSKLGTDLQPSACPSGIDAEATDRCMEAIRTESCNNPVDTLSRLAACRSSDLCRQSDTTKKR